MRKNTNTLLFLVVVILCAIVTFTCKKLEKSMLVSTGEVSNVKTNSADAGGVVIDLGDDATQHGHCYGTSPGLTVAGTRTQLGKPSAGGFTSQLTDLTAGTKYYVKAYISSGSETVYGKDEISFTTTAASLPVLTTATVTAVTFTTATSGGEVTGDGGAPVTARGVCWSTSSGPTTDDSRTSDNTGTGVFTSNLTGLTPNTTYFVRAWATNTAGTGYGEEQSFKTIAATPPVLSTAAVTDITQNTATSGGNITGDGGVPVTARGVCWNTTGNPTTADSKTEDGEGTGSFVSSLTGLTGNTTYYVRSYATNSAGTSYGDEISFKTGAVLPALTTTAVTSVTTTGAVSGGDVTDDGGSPVTARGVCWSTSSLPTIEDNITLNETGTGSFASNITGLTANTKYYVRAYAKNDVGTAYGDEVNFTTSTATIGLSTISTTAITAVTSASASSGGNITSNGGSTITVSGVCWSTTSNPTIGDSKTTDGTGTGSFTSSITGLIANTKYYVRAYATNSAGTAYGNELSFTTSTSSATPPTAAVAAATSVTNTSATVNGAVNANGTVSTVTFEYGTTTLYGSNINATPSEVSGTGTTSVSASLTGLAPGTLVHYRVKAVNGGGTAYSDDLTFTTTQVPDAMTEAATSVATTDATLNATVNANNLSTTVTFEYGTTIGYGNTVTAVPNPVSGGTPSAVSYGLTGLLPNATYYFRIKALSTGGTAYGDQLSFTTLASVATTAVTSVTTSSAASGGTITAGGGATITSRGVCWSTSPNPTLINSKTNDGTGIGSFASSITGLVPCTNYYVRAYATNSTGTSYGQDVPFTTGEVLANVNTTSISSVTSTTASSGGNVSGDCANAVTARGICWNTSGNPTITDSKTVDGSGSGSFTSSLTGITSNTIYYVRAYATNSAGTTYGSELIFTSLASLATSPVSVITSTTASSGGTIDTGGSANITARGVCWSTSTNPTITNNKSTNGTGTGSFTSSITGLTPNTTYYTRAYATNSGGTAYGDQLVFTSTITVTDIDGNTYNTVQIGTQFWMLIDLKTTKYNDGTNIPLETDNTAWSNLTTPGYCWYDNDQATYMNTYGALYNWYAVNTGKLCPNGWHVPTDAEWTNLTDYLGGAAIAGGKLKETGTTHWYSPNYGASNISGFTALPCGIRRTYGFDDVRFVVGWWSATQVDASRAWGRGVSYDNYNVQIPSTDKYFGYSVRCVRD